MPDNRRPPKAIMASIRTQGEFKRRCRQGIPILLFHKIGKCPASANMPRAYVSPTHFDKLLDEFKRKSFQSISISDAVQPPKTKIGNRFVISFDDGYEGALIYAAQKIKEHGFTAIQFLVANRLGQRNEWDLGLDTTIDRLMDRTQVQEWLSLGFEIGAHTLTQFQYPRRRMRSRAAKKSWKISLAFTWSTSPIHGEITTMLSWSWLEKLDLKQDAHVTQVWCALTWISVASADSTPMKGLLGRCRTTSFPTCVTI
jgi:hypothetical protein